MANVGYIAKLPGILKLVAFLLGFIIAIAMFVLSSPPSPLQYAVDEHQYLVDNPGTKEPYEIIAGMYFMDDGVNNGYTGCKAVQKTVPEDERKTCPPPALITLSAVIAIACCLFSIVFLLLCMFTELTKNGLFVKIDMFGHLGAGACLILAGIMTIGFAALAFMYADCGERTTDEGKEKCNKNRERATRSTAFICCGVMLFIDGAVSIVAGVTAKKKN